MTMKPSAPLTGFVKAYESLHDGDLKKIGLQPKVCPAGYWTEGYGRVLLDHSGKMIKYSSKYSTIESVMPFATINTEAEAAADLAKGLELKAVDVRKWLKIPVSQNQFDALVSHAYNCGYSSTMYKLVNGGAPESEIKRWFTTKYITAGGKFMLGLQYRRNDEYEMWLKGDYKRDYKRSI